MRPGQRPSGDACNGRPAGRLPPRSGVERAGAARANSARNRGGCWRKPHGLRGSVKRRGGFFGEAASETEAGHRPCRPAPRRISPRGRRHRALAQTRDPASRPPLFRPGRTAVPCVAGTTRLPETGVSAPHHLLRRAMADGRHALQGGMKGRNGQKPRQRDSTARKGLAA